MPGMASMNKWAVAIHGGAGVIERTLDPKAAAVRISRLEAVLASAREQLSRGESALNAVEQAVVGLEEAPEFNAGKGAVLTAAGTHELEAAIMAGHSGACGAVCLLETIRNPIRLARFVLDRSPHVLLAGDAAERLAEDLDRVANDWFRTDLREEQWKKWKSTADEADAKGPATVGAVALDMQGNLAAATSTGGRTGKPCGRIGDTPTIGAGTWADQRCAISSTGHGEAFMAAVAAHTVACRLEFCSEKLEVAMQQMVHEGLPARSGGMIAVDTEGTIAMPFNCEGMYRGAADSMGRFGADIWS